MNQNYCFNIFVVLVILIIIKYISPDNDSVLYVLKKYLNFLIFKVNHFLKTIFNCNEKFMDAKFTGNTFTGIPKFNDKAPTFISHYENNLIKKMILKNPQLDINVIKKLYMVIDKLVTIDVDDYFMTGNDFEYKTFTADEVNKIKKILLNKLNTNDFVFSNLNINDPITYYNNVSGKAVNPFSFTVDCDQNIGTIKISVEIDIRNDIIKNSSYLIIKKSVININDNDNINDKIQNTEINLNIPYLNEVEQNINKPPSSDNNVINYNYSFDPYIDNTEIDMYTDLETLYNPDTNSSEQHNYSLEQPNSLFNNSSNSSNFSIDMPLVNFSKNFLPNKSLNIEPSNNDDTYINMLDNLENFKIPVE